MFGSVEQSEPAKGYFEGSLRWLETVYLSRDWERRDMS